LIACRQTSSLRYISCSCPIGDEQSEVHPRLIQLLRR
jgi:hypothetical protein